LHSAVERLPVVYAGDGCTNVTRLDIEPNALAAVTGARVVGADVDVADASAATE